MPSPGELPTFLVVNMSSCDLSVLIELVDCSLPTNFELSVEKGIVGDES